MQLAQLAPVFFEEWRALFNKEIKGSCTAPAVWDMEAGTCRLEVYGDDGAFAAHEDPYLEVISELALEWLRAE